MDFVLNYTTTIYCIDRQLYNVELFGNLRIVIRTPEFYIRKDTMRYITDDLTHPET